MDGAPLVQGGHARFTYEEKERQGGKEEKRMAKPAVDKFQESHLVRVRFALNEVIDCDTRPACLLKKKNEMKNSPERQHLL